MAQALGAAEYLCRNVSLEQGLSQSNVTALTRDGRGFLWIGTRFGLNRYDFQNIVNYYYDPATDTSLPDNDIRSLFTDSRGRLWVASASCLSRYNDRLDSFERILEGPANNNIRSFYEEADGLLIGGPGAIYYNDFATDATVRLQVKGGSRYAYTSIHRRSPGFYILATRWDGLWLFDREHATITPLEEVPNKGIMASEIDSRGVMWVAPYAGGLVAYDAAGTRLFAFNTENSDLRSNIILDIVEHDRRIWIATDGGGISIYNPETESFEDSSFHQSLHNLGSVTTLYPDTYGNLFVGTVRDGAASIRPVAIHCFQANENARFASISSVFRDDSGDIWLGDDGRGVLRYDFATEDITNVPSTVGLKVVDVSDHSPEDLLVITFDKGFFLLNKKSGALRRAPDPLQELWAENSNHAVPMHASRLADNMIAIIGEDIRLYNPRTGLVSSVGGHSGSNVPRGAIVPIYCRNGRLLCKGTDFISEFDPLTGSHVKVFQVGEHERIYCAAFDGARTLFIGTDKGVIRYDMTTATSQPIPGVKDRPSALAFESPDRLWIATTRILYLCHTDSGNILGFGISDGVKPNEYLTDKQLFADGRLFFGGSYGLLRVNTAEINNIVASQTDPRITVANIEVDGVPAYQHIENGVLDIPDTHSSVSLTVIDCGSNTQRSQLLRYIVRGSGPERKIETFSRSLDLNFMEPGNNYHVLLSSMRNDGSWTQPQELVTLAVMSPWFKSPWVAITVAVLLIAALIIAERRRTKLRKAKVDSELELYRRNTLERELAFLMNTNSALRTPLTLIYAPVKLLLERVRNGEHTDLVPALEGIYRNTKKMRDTIDMALELHNVTVSPDKSQLSTHDISRSIEDVREALAHDFELKHLSCIYISSEEMFPAIYDRQRLGSVIEVLLRNAIQRSPDHSAIDIRAERRGEYIRVSISDTGEHLDPETLSELFSRYFNDDNSKFGNSLGFAYAKNLIDMQGGHIGAENNDPMPGITVWFEFPAAGAPAVEAYTRRRHNEAAGIPDAESALLGDIDTSSLTIVVVEEDNDLCMFMAMELSEHFGKVLHAFNGRDALMLIRQTQPDIVITSLMLPLMSGLELCRSLKKSPQTNHIPIILLTSLKEGATIENAYGAGADSYLSKPFDMNILMTRCRNLLHARAVIRDRYTGQPASSEPRRRNMTNADETFMLKINKIMEAHLADPEFGVDTLVEEMALSRSALYARFKDITGQSIGSYIADCRFKKAKDLLCESSLTVNEISELLGFSSQRYFSTFFKDRAGVPPSAFRAKNKAVNT